MICCGWLTSHHAAEKNYQIYELGFNPEAKIKIIEGMLSPKGKLYNVRPGSVFVTDEPEILKGIEEIIKNPDLDRVEQVQLTLRRKGSQNAERNQRQISGVITPKEVKVQGQFGQNGMQSLGNTDQCISAILGETAYLSLGTTSTQLEQFRRRFLQITTVQEELEALQVLVQKSGKVYRVKLVSVYRARVDGRWKTFETGSINTTVLCPPGQWLNIGGNNQASSSSQRSMLGLNRDDSEGSRLQDLELSVEPVKMLK